MSKFCPSCGNEVHDKAVICTSCGCKVSNDVTVQSDPNKTNGLCIAGFIVSFFSPLIGLILSICGLNAAKNKNQGGRGLAIAGIIISVVNFVLALIILTTVFSTSAAINYYF